MTTILLVVGILMLLILVHELGHFIAAKFFRVRVEEFGIGFPPRALTFGKWGGTEYTLNWVPFGGFVRLFGDIGEGRHGQGSFVDKNRGVQAVILAAGVFMNLVAAWALFTGALYIGIPRLVDSIEQGANQWLLVAEVVADSPAFVAGLSPGDRITSVVASDGEEVAVLTPTTVSDFIQERGGESLEISYVRGGATTVVTVRSAHAVISDSAERPAIGVALALVSDEPLPLLVAMKDASVSTYNAFKAVLGGLWEMVKSATNGVSPLKDIVGPIGLVGIAGAAAESGVGNILALAAFISINLFIINLLPIPALDGGRLFVLGIETLIRRNASQVAIRLLNAFGIAFIVFLMVAVTWNDIARLFT